MRFSLIQVGKTTDAYLNQGIDTYRKRLQPFSHTEIIEIPYLKQAKNLSENQQKNLEGIEIIKKLPEKGFIVLLDEQGNLFNSVSLAKYIQKQHTMGNSHLVFVIGGAYGFSDAVYERSHAKIALSPLTFSHQLVRLVFWEQIYRIVSIINNTPYHHA